MEAVLSQRLGAAAFAFRGYNVTNLGRTRELLARAEYEPTLSRYLSESSALCGDLLRSPVDLRGRIEANQESTVESFGEDIGLILAVELAQIELLRERFDIDYHGARLALGYSLGEVAALVAGGVFSLADVLTPLVTLSIDCVDLARDVTMGVVFSRGPAISYDTIERLCLQISCQGAGVVAISAHLSPNTVLVLGQQDTVDTLKARIAEETKGAIHVRKNSSRWPPLHTPLLCQRCVSDRAATMMYQLAGGMTAPRPPVVSLVTGKASYNDHNSRALLTDWVDRPQRLWDALHELMCSGIDTIVHVGPEPNLLPATFKRLSDNITTQMQRWSINAFGYRAMSNLVRRPWLTKVLSNRTALLRVPFVKHVILEDWLLEQTP